MDQAFLEREKELFKLNAKLNAKTKKIAASTVSNKTPSKTVQIHTANNNLNYYEDMTLSSLTHQKEQHDDGLELLCKRINISNQPVRKTHEIVYPLFNRQQGKSNHPTDIHIHLPNGALIADGDAEPIEVIETVDLKSETVDESFKNESLVTRYSDDSSAVPPAPKVDDLPMPPNFVPSTNTPKPTEKKNTSNDGLLKFLKSKVALLQTELEAGKNLNDTLEKENAKHLKKIRKLTSQLDKATGTNNSLEGALQSMREKQEADEQNLKDKDTIISALNKELLSANEDFNEKNLKVQLLEKQLLKTQEDYEMIKTKFESFKDIEIIMRESAKEERIAYEEKIRKLRKGRMDLLKAYKQQIILIDNLRRQNVCLEKAKALEIAEKEFLKVLDWNWSDKQQ